jgi:hypothetical protein
MRGAIGIASTGTLVILAAFLSGCSRGVETTDLPSPNGQLILRVEVNESGGAAVPDVTSAYLFIAGSSEPHKELIFRGSAMDHFNASWRGQELVALSYTGGYVSTCAVTSPMSADLKIVVLGCR